MRFVDEATISVRAGNGGHGCVSFRREKFIPRGGPDGGDGGRGGDVIFRASPRLLTLYDFRLRRRYCAENGRGGAGREKSGRAGQDLIIEVPLGTLIYEIPGEPGEDGASSVAEKDRQPRLEADGQTMVWDLPQGGEGEPEHAAEETAEEGENAGAEMDEPEVGEGGYPQAGPRLGERLMADLAEPDQMMVVAKAGRGGKGNTHFKTATMRTPRFAQPGEEGQELRLRLVLKILADAGIIGLPNAGKSTLISAISAARPKIAAYPFTTLTPSLGVMERESDQRLVVADIPGLIEGAHLGQGLGHRFLKHVERTRFLVHLLSLEEIDPDWEAKGGDPFAGFDLVNEELALFDPVLARKAQIEVVNKIDLWPKEALEPLVRFAESRGRKVYFLSALKGWGVEPLVGAMWRALANAV